MILINPTLEESLKHTQCARIGRDIDFNRFVVKYAKVLSSNPVDSNKQRKITEKFISVLKQDGKYSNKCKEDFISILKWVEL